MDPRTAYYPSARTDKYPRALRVDFRKLRPGSLRRYLDAFELPPRPDATPAELAVAVARHFEHHLEVDEDSALARFMNAARRLPPAAAVGDGGAKRASRRAAADEGGGGGGGGGAAGGGGGAPPSRGGGASRYGADMLNTEEALDGYEERERDGERARGARELRRRWRRTSITCHPFSAPHPSLSPLSLCPSLPPSSRPAPSQCRGRGPARIVARRRR